MKLNHIVITALIGSVFLAGCSDDKAKVDSHAGHDHDSHQAVEKHEANSDGLVLNNGEKWEMDEHTRNSFSKMAESFLLADHSSLDDAGLRQSGAALQEELDVLIKGCTMTGEAHNQLHVYLTSYIPAVQALSESGDMEDAKKVKHYLEIYDDYLK